MTSVRRTGHPLYTVDGVTIADTTRTITGESEETSPVVVGDAGVAAPTIVSGGGLGASRDQTVASNVEVWLHGTLTANHTLTLTMGAGSRLRLFGVQDATGGRTLTISDGSTSQSVTVPATPAAAFQITVFSDGDALYIDGSRGVPGVGAGPAEQLVSTVPFASATATTATTANGMSGAPVRIPYTGVLRDFYVFVATTLNTAQIKGAIYDVGQTAATLRTRLWESSASTLGGSNNYWHAIGDPQLSVTAGQYLDLSIMCDSATPTFARAGTFPASNLSSLPAGFMTSNGTTAKLAWSHSPGSFAFPASLNSASAPTVGTAQILMMARVV